jgi:arylsulfatase A-like enzyme
MLAAVLLLAWAQPMAAAAERPRPNVVLFCVDTLRADRVHCLGYPRQTTPALDTVAREGTLFEAAMAPSSWSLPSYCSILGSLHAPSHAVSKQNQRFDASFLTLPGVLAANGYATGGFVGGGHLSRSFGLDSGFGTYRDQPHFGSFYHTVREALDWLDAGASRGPFFALIQGYDVHLPYQPPLGFAEMYDPGYRGLVHDRNLLQSDVLRNVTGNLVRLPVRTEVSAPRTRPASSGFASSILDVPPGTPIEQIPLSEADRKHLEAHYDGAVTYADAWLGVLRRELRVRGLLENTLLIVTSDHGESLGEHGYYGHSWDLYDEQLHVPLAFAGPGIVAGRRIREVVGLVDLAPTVLELCRVQPCLQFQGQSLAPHVAAAVPPPPRAEKVVFSALRTAVSARTGRWHLILGPRGQAALYDLPQDPREQRDVSAAHPGELQLLRGQAQDWYEAYRRAPRGPDSRLTAEERQMFRDKGYW